MLGRILGLSEPNQEEMAAYLQHAFTGDRGWGASANPFLMEDINAEVRSELSVRTNPGAVIEELLLRSERGGEAVGPVNEEGAVPPAEACTSRNTVETATKGALVDAGDLHQTEAPGKEGLFELLLRSVALC